MRCFLALPTLLALNSSILIASEKIKPILRERASHLQMSLPYTMGGVRMNIHDRATQDLLDTFINQIEHLSAEEAQATFALIEQHAKRKDYEKIDTTISIAGNVFSMTYDQNLHAVKTVKQKSEDTIRHEIAFREIREREIIASSLRRTMWEEIIKIVPEAQNPASWGVCVQYTLWHGVSQKDKDQVSSEEVFNYPYKNEVFEFYPEKEVTLIYRN